MKACEAADPAPTAAAAGGAAVMVGSMTTTPQRQRESRCYAGWAGWL